MQESIAQEDALLKHTVAEVRWQEWSEKARQQAMLKVCDGYITVECSQPLPLQAQAIEEKSQQQKRKKADQVTYTHTCTHTHTHTHTHSNT